MTVRRVRMADVAQAAGVSRTTASFVINGIPTRIPEETRQRVLRAAEQMGYKRHATAVALVTGRTRRIGVMLNDPARFDATDQFFSCVLAGITKGALHHQYNLVLHTIEHPDWQALYSDIVSPTADGTLLIGRYADDPLTAALLDAGFPTVCISYEVEHPRCCSVDCDNLQGGYLAAQHLIQLGHRVLALFYPGDRHSWGKQRRQGALQAMAEAGLPPENLIVSPWPDTSLPSVEWTVAAVPRLLAREPRPTALIVAEEVRACGLVEALPQAGLRVPDDLSMITFNSTEQSARTHPPLTSVGQPLEEIGAAAVDALVDLIERRPMSQPRRRFAMRLDIRQSCGPPPRSRS